MNVDSKSLLSSIHQLAIFVQMQGRDTTPFLWWQTRWLRFLLSMLLPGFYVDWVRSMRYGFWGGVDWQMGKMPADFLIGPEGQIVKAHYGREMGDHLPVTEVEATLSELASSTN